MTACQEAAEPCLEKVNANQDKMKAILEGMEGSKVSSKKGWTR
jgi:hypothetical protein